MKKILSVLMVLALLLGSCSAFADDVKWSTGSGFSINITTFKTYFNTMASATGYSFTWSSSTKTEDGYKVYTAKSSDSLFTVKVYTKSSKVYMIYGETSASSSNAEAMGSWLGAAMFASVYSVYLGDHNDLPESVINSSLTEVENISSWISSIGSYSESSLRSGVVKTSKMCGYPYALQLKVSGSSVYSLKISIQMYIVPSGGRVSAN